jgi:hypothetical protein
MTRPRGASLFLLCAALACALALAGGCDAEALSGGGSGNRGGEILRGVNAAGGEERMAALRAVSARVDARRRAGDEEGARRLEEIVIRRYFVEPEQEVRACIVLVCAPASGRSAAMVRFLRDRIASGEFSGYAALSLSAMAPRSAYSDIEPLTRHPSHEVRLQAATALTVLGDARGYESVVRVRRGMEPGLWPEAMDGVTLLDARAELDARARRAFGRELR